jgi:hypothetical protein
MSNKIDINNLLNKSKYYNWIHSEKYEYYKKINKLFINIILFNTFFSKFLVIYFKNMPYLNYYTFVSDSFIILVMFVLFMTYQQENAHKISTDNWYRYILYLKSLDDNDIDSTKYLIAKYNYAIYSKYSKRYIDKQDIDKLKIKYNNDLNYIDDLIKEIIY